MHAYMRLLLITWLAWLPVGLSANSRPLSDWRSEEARVFFPEQIEYLQLALELCRSDELILWGDGRCYREFERGPCNADRVLLLDRVQLKPYCKLVI